MSLVIGIDPGTGRKSDTGIAVFDTDTKAIWLTTNFKPASEHRDEPQHILRDLTKKLEALFQKLEQYPQQLACIETFVMQGKGGQTLQELRGALMSAIPYTTELQVVFNTTVKRLVAGTGSADKREVGMGVANYFGSNAESLEKVTGLIEAKEWDQLDALAIGIAGHMKAGNSEI